MADTVEKKEKKKVWAILLLVALAIGVVGGAYAYFTSRSETVTNTFTISENDPDGKLGVIEEPEWSADDPSEHLNLQPNFIIAKDPLFKSLADWDSWVFMEVTVPKVEASDAGKIQVGGTDVLVGTPLVLIDWDFNQDYVTNYTDQAADATKMTLKQNNPTGWSLVAQDTATNAAYNTYVFGYGTKVTKDVPTSKCFEHFQVLNFTKYESKGELNVNCTARMVQTEGYEGATYDVYKNVFAPDNANMVQPTT